MVDLQAPQGSRERQRLLSVRQIKRRSLIRPSFTTHGFKETFFNATDSPSNDDPTNTRIVTDSKGYSLICPINVLDTSTDHLVSICDPSPHLSLPFNVHRINKSLFLAPKGKWSNLDYVLNKDPLVEVFIDDFRLWSELDRLNKTVYFNAFNMVLANLLHVHQSSSQLLVSRRSGKYKRNNPDGIDNRTITKVTDYLADRGMIALHIGRQSDRDENTSWCIPLAPLIAVLEKHDAQLRLHNNTQFAVVRDAKKNHIPVYTNTTKAHRLNKLAQPVRDHYTTWLNHTAMLDDSYLLPWLQRKFNLNMNLGGRFYGHYQNIPSADRKRIRIDGEATVELDYKAHHIAILYALEGSRPGCEPYLIEGHEEKREAIKSIFLRLVNAENLTSLKATITRSGNPKIQKKAKEYEAKRAQYEKLRSMGLRAREPSKPKCVKNGFISNIPEGAKGDDYMNLILNNNSLIKHHFGTENIGLRLQKLDSDLMALVLTKLDGIPCLPVHDSVRCRVSDMDAVHNAMIDSFKEMFGQTILITNDIDNVDNRPPELPSNELCMQYQYDFISNQ
jgi:hypothetical protein